MLEVKHISKAYKDNVILEDINFTIKKGEVISIVGNSGCGKSTILKCLNRIENISSGEIILNGKDITEYKVEELRQKIGLVFQDYNLFEHLTIIDNLTIGLIKLKGYSKESATNEALKLLSKLKLLDKVNKKLNNLLELNLEGRINKEQYTLKFDELDTQLIKIDSKIQRLLKETNRTESIKQRLNKFKSLFKNIDIMPKFDKDVFECLIDKVIIGEIEEDGIINPYTIRFICKNGSEINCRDEFTATSDKQATNNIATSDKQRTWSVARY